MLCLAPIELVTDAERRLHRVLSGFGSGSGVLGGLVVFVPVVDGAMQRRQADAVAFLPETVAVVRVLGMGRQSGELRPSPTGTWTVGGDVLRLSGGGSSPAGQLYRAAELIDGALRSGGLDPGHLPALAVIDGPITSVRDRAAGGPIACSLDAGEVLTGLRHTAAAGLQADTRVWTTADVKAALAIFGLQARGPSVEDLNNEGFLYSPYVLRRSVPAARPAGQQPVAMLAGPPAAVGNATEAVHVRTAPARVQGARAADRAGESPHPLTHLAAPPDASDRRSDLADLFDRPEPRTGERSSRSKRWLGVAVLLLLAAAAGVFFAFASGLRDPQAGRSPSAGSSEPATGTSPSALTSAPATQVVEGSTYTLQATRTDSDCAGNAYGQVADFLAASPCSGLTRALFTTSLGQAMAVVSVSVVHMPDAGGAAELQQLADTNGTGNVSDLLRAGVQIDGGPSELVAAAYASRLAGTAVRIVEVAWMDEQTAGDDALLESAADDALLLDVPEA